MDEQDTRFLRAAIAVAGRSREHGNHPFGALLVDERGTLVLEAENTVVTEKDSTGHAETNLVRLASRRFPPGQLEKYTVYTSTEPCAMCTGAIHWGHIGRLVYALSEAHLFEMIGSHRDNETMHLPCREVLDRCARKVEVAGPALEDEARQAHLGFWQ